MATAVDLRKIARWIRRVSLIDEQTIGVRLSKDVDFAVFMIQLQINVNSVYGKRYYGAPWLNIVKDEAGNCLGLNDQPMAILITLPVGACLRSGEQLVFCYLDLGKGMTHGIGYRI